MPHRAGYGRAVIGGGWKRQVLGLGYGKVTLFRWAEGFPDRETQHLTVDHLAEMGPVFSVRLSQATKEWLSHSEFKLNFLSPDWPWQKISPHIAAIAGEEMPGLRYWRTRRSRTRE